MLPFNFVPNTLVGNQHSFSSQQKKCIRNGVSMEEAAQKQAANLLGSDGDCLTLSAMSGAPQEGRGAQIVDYTDRCPLPISIPDHSLRNGNGQSYVVFNIHMAGRQLISRRYSEFSNLHATLRKKFVGFNFPHLPGKWPFKLSKQQLDTRRRGLEQYLEKVCAVRAIAATVAVQDFLAYSVDGVCAIKVMLPDHEDLTISVRRSDNAQLVWNILVERAKLSPYTRQYFYLFKSVEPNFERKLQPHEIPHQLYSISGSTRLCVRRWLFSVSRELTIPSGEQAEKFIFYQTVNEVNRGNICAQGRLSELRALQHAKKAAEYLAIARTLRGYGDVIFPHCACDSRREGHVVPVVGMRSFRLHACRDDGSMEAQVVELTWDSITIWKIEEEPKCFSFEFKQPDKPPRWIKVYTPYHVFLVECFERITAERKWDDSDK